MKNSDNDKQNEINENSNEVQEKAIKAYNREAANEEQTRNQNEIHIDMTKLGNETAKNVGNKNKSFVVYQYFGYNQDAAGAQGGNDIGTPLEYDPNTRNSFVLYVTTIVFIMLMCTIGFNVIVFMSPQMKSFFQTMGFAVAIPAMLVVIGLNFTMACSTCARRAPCNIICLFLTFVAMSFVTSYITVRYDTELVMYAIITTAVVVFICVCLACTNFDFTKWMLYVIVISATFSVLALIVGLSMAITGEQMPMMALGILIVGTLINVVVLIIELQTILGGKAVEMSEDDYAFGAFMLYVSIIDIFLKLVQIFGILDSM